MAANDETLTLATSTSDAESKSKDKEEVTNTSAETKSPATTNSNGDKSAISTPKRRIAVQKVASGGVQNSYLTRRRQHQIDHANRPCFTPNVEAENCLFELLNSSPIGQPVGLMRHHNLAVILNDLGEAVKKKAAAGNTALAAGLDAIFPKPSGTAPDHRPALCSKWNALYHMDALNCRRAVTDFPDAEARKASSPWTPYSARSKAAQFTSKDLKLMNKSGGCSSSSSNSSSSNSSKQNNSSSNSNSSRGKKVNTKSVSFSFPPTMPSENEEIPLETVQSVLAVNYSQLSKKLKKVKLSETLMQQVNTAKEKVAALATEVASTTSATVTVKQGTKSGTKNAAAAVVAGDQEKGEKGDKKSKKEKKKVAKIMEKAVTKLVVKEEKMNDDDKEVIPSTPTVPEAARGQKAQVEKVAQKAPGAGGKVSGRCSQDGKVCARGALRRITRNSTTSAKSRQTRSGRDGRGCGRFPITGTRRKSLSRAAKVSKLARRLGF